MNRSVKIWLGVVLGLALLVVLWWLRREEPHSSGVANHPTSVSTHSEEARPHESASEHETTKNDPMPRAPGLSDQAWTYISRLYTASIAENNPMQFHGRVLDQNGEPVPGVIITTVHSWFDEAWIRRAYPKSPPGNESGGVPVVAETNQIITASDGSFHLMKSQATSLYIRDLEKDGYVWDQGSDGASFAYSARLVGQDAAKWPNYMKADGDFIIRVWRKGAVEPLIPINVVVNMDIEQQGQWVSNYFVSFIPQRVEQISFSDADLEIKGIRRMTGNPNRPFEFSFTLSVPDGGIAFVDDAYLYQAPSAGYQASWSFQNRPQLNPPDYPWARTAYLKLRGGNAYAGIQIIFCKGGFNFQFKGYLNPSGSRNLEPGAEKLITDPEEIRRLNEETRVKK